MRARSLPTRQVRCLHCSTHFHVAEQAMVLTCPACYKRVTVQDVIVNTAQNMSRVETCGSVLIRRGGKVLAGTVQASVGIEVLGELYATTVAAPVVYIGPKATWRGDLTAGSIVIEPGAKVLGGCFKIQKSATRPAAAQA